MKILILTTKICNSDGSPWLCSELAGHLALEGHEVSLVNIEWSGKNVDLSWLKKQKNINIYNFVALRYFNGSIGLGLRWLMSSLQALPLVLRWKYSGEKFDLLIGFSPCFAIWSVLPIFQKICTKAILLYWDFFPLHNQTVANKIPKYFLPLLKKAEERLVNGYKAIGLMSLANMRYCESYFNLSGDINRFVIPIWTSFLTPPDVDVAAVRQKYSMDYERIYFIFGGQLTRGRGLEVLLDSVILASSIDDRITLIVCGDGDLEDVVLDSARINIGVIQHIGRIPRIDYLNLVACCDVGVISTDQNVESPTFPSKILDYMACRKPVVAALEDASDLGGIIEGINSGFPVVLEM